MAKIPKAESAAEAELALWIRTSPDVPPPVREFQFHPTRKWRFDFAWPQIRLAVEIEGLTADGGRHQRIGGFSADLAKYHAAWMLNWRVYRCSASMVSSGEAIAAIRHGFRYLT